MTREEQHERREEMLRLVRGGMAPREVAERFGVTPNLVRHYCKQSDVRPSDGTLRPGTLKASTYRILAALIRGGKTHAEIAKAFRVSRQRVSEIAHAAQEAGIALNDSGTSPENL